ncbi:VacJ family lipoprotein [Parasphingopyxis sp. CP4]|uniref:MlaA family lipoprotein n=1 Tax=Parasphingopyxis sp. CP4 TaxID=2724527 RepID=UPI0015A4B528|nr:VacJ family lipoprotein [Parasphingopyxis sp. CP4]QLC22174.1 VacJ family lipoprotein [Parasphingopyxis sp. CP4]
MRKLLMSLLLALCLSACATTQAGPNGMADRDPHEEFNRDMWAVNQGIDDVAIRPVTNVYRAVTPRPLRSGVSNVFRNLTEPWSFINNILQGRPGRALRNLGRFIVNSTIGIGGLFDHASALGIDPAPEDFGQTLAVWGVGDGGYVLNPIFGPSTQRDTFGLIVDIVANPVSLFFDRGLNLSSQEQLAIRAGGIISVRSDLMDTGVDAFLDSSADPYAAARSAYFQTREAQILNYDMSGMNAGDGDLENSEDAAFEAALEDLDEMDDFDAPTVEDDPTVAEPQ